MIITKANVFADWLSETNTTKLETLVVHFADICLEDYSRGQWEYIKTHSMAMYMRLPYEGKRILKTQNKKSSLDFDAAGVAMTLRALDQLAFYLHDRNSPELGAVVGMSRELRKYAAVHTQANQIFKFTD